MDARLHVGSVGRLHSIFGPGSARGPAVFAAPRRVARPRRRLDGAFHTDRATDKRREGVFADAALKHIQRRCGWDPGRRLALLTACIVAAGAPGPARLGSGVRFRLPYLSLGDTGGRPGPPW